MKLTFYFVSTTEVNKNCNVYSIVVEVVVVVVVVTLSAKWYVRQLTLKSACHPKWWL